MSWLKGYMATLRAAAAFCFDLIDDDTHLLLAPGSLMIDVFIRQVVVGNLSHFAFVCFPLLGPQSRASSNVKPIA